jgi:alpha-L-rhamnosidase
MKRILSLISAGILLSSISLLAQTQKLRCEYLENPLGIDQTAPRFTWEFTTKQNPVSVKICVDTDSLALVKGRNNTWTSSNIASPQQLAIVCRQTLTIFPEILLEIGRQKQSNTECDCEF